MYRRHIFRGKLLTFSTSRLDLPDGKKGYFEEVHHPGASLVVPFVGKRIIFIRQFRAVIGRYIWELPAGTLKKGEHPRACASREIIEETGYKAVSMKKLGLIYTSPGFCDEVIHIFKASCVPFGPGHDRDDDEFITVRIFSAKEVKRLFASGRIVDSKTVSALAFAGVI